MKTSRPFSSVSYNTQARLKEVLDNQLDIGVIGFYAFIFHFAEHDEVLPHFHVYVEPNGKLDTVEFSNLFIELVYKENTSRRWMPCHSTTFDDWFFYAMRPYTLFEFKGIHRK